MTSKSPSEGTAYCFDLDGTITQAELLPRIAAEIGLGQDMAALTKAAMEGHTTFEPSFRHRCQLLSEIAPDTIRRIVSQVPLDPHILQFIQDNRSDCFILTGNLDIWIGPILERCGCRAYSSEATYTHGTLELKTILNKAQALRHIRSALGYRRTIAVGDGANDAAMLSEATIGIAFAGVHPPAASAIEAAQHVATDGQALCRLLRSV
jgi:HAD superfamily phosphoserine phosphatase-like hydrolase